MERIRTDRARLGLGLDPLMTVRLSCMGHGGVMGSLFLPGGGWGWWLKSNGCNELAKWGPLKYCIQRGCAKFFKTKELGDG